MVLCHKKESIYYDAASQVRVYHLWCCVTRRKVSIMSLCHNMESIHYGAKSKEGQSYHKKESFHYWAVLQEGEYLL